MKHLKIGIDIDGTITSAPDFFRQLTEQMSEIADIHIITFRPKKYKFETIQQLSELGIKYDHLVFTDNKADYIMQNYITIFFEDMDEFIVDLPSSVTVFKIREKGNFDFEEKKWIYTPRTGYNEFKGPE